MKLEYLQTLLVLTDLKLGQENQIVGSHRGSSTEWEKVWEPLPVGPIETWEAQSYQYPVDSCISEGMRTLKGDPMDVEMHLV